MSTAHVVLGAAGFLGSHLTDNLLDSGLTVIGIDDLSSGRIQNLQSAFKNQRFRFIEHDIRNPIKIENDVAAIYNFASLASPPRYLNDPIHTLLTGSVGTSNSLEMAHAKGARYIYISTSEVYGDPLVHPQHEGYWGNVNPVGVRSCYDEAKRFGEAITMAFIRKLGLNAGIIRVFNTYGPRMRPDDGRVMTNMIVRGLSNSPMTVFGSGCQTRSFCYVADLIDGVRSFAASNLNGPINLGNSSEISIMDLSKLVSAVLGVPHSVKYFDLPHDDPQMRRPDVRKAENLLGWEPKTPLDVGIRLTIDWLRHELEL